MNSLVVCLFVCLYVAWLWLSELPQQICDECQEHLTTLQKLRDAAFDVNIKTTIPTIQTITTKAIVATGEVGIAGMAGAESAEEQPQAQAQQLSATTDASAGSVGRSSFQDHYSLQSVIGHGAFSAVHIAHLLEEEKQLMVFTARSKHSRVEQKSKSELDAKLDEAAGGESETEYRFEEGQAVVYKGSSRG